YSRTSYPVSLFGLLFLGRRDRFWISILGFWLSLLVLCPSVGSSRQREKPIESEEKEDGPTSLWTVPRSRPLASPTETAGRPAVSPSWSGGWFPCFDITDRKMAEQVLHENEIRLRLLVEQMPAVLFTLDRDLRITSSTGAGLANLNLRPNEVV